MTTDPTVDLRATEMRHQIVYREADRFCGWPANHGLWTWGDEILVGFERARFQPHENEHSLRRDLPSELIFVRSMDGGESWRLDDDAHWTLAKPGLLTSSRESTVPLHNPIDFDHPDFAMKCFGGKFVISYDRGHHWHGPFAFPDLGNELTARTDYVVEGAESCLILLAATEPAVSAPLKDRAFCLHTADGGKSFQMRGHLTGDPIAVRSVMPATVRGQRGQLISALRRRHDTHTADGPRQSCWIDLYHSEDDGHHWEYLSKVADTGEHNGNPPALVRLHNGRLCVAYGVRRAPFGMRAKLSRDDGRTWGEEIALRTDARSWDIGYPRMVQRSDGLLITLYYYTTTTNPEQYIAATIWDPNTFR